MNATTTYDLYTEAQQLTLVIIPYFTAPLSALGSALVIYVILADRQKTLKETYHRLMLGLSTMDFLSSMGMLVFGHWAVPKGVDFVPGASGTFTTCSISGFFLNLMLGSMWYSFFLALYFLLLIRFEWQKKRIARWVEPFGHFFGIVWPVAGASFAVAYNWINPLVQLPGFCWNSDYPPNCTDNDNVPCLRGEGYDETVQASTIVFLFIGIVVCMILIFIRVRSTEKKIRKYAGGQNHTLEQTRQTGIQSLLYILAFFLVYFPIVVVGNLGNDFSSSRRTVSFTFAFLTKLLTPMQGFFNSWIYLRKRLHVLTEKGQSLSFFRHVVHTSTTTLPTTEIENGRTDPSSSMTQKLELGVQEEE